MQYIELVKKIEQGKISVGDRVWIVDFRREQPELKPVRNIAPTEVVLTAEEDLPPGKYLSGGNHYFRPLGKNGNPLVTVISAYPGYWGSHSDSLHIFLTREEAREKYLEQCEFMRQQALQAQEEWYNKFNAVLDELDEKVEAELKN